MLETYWEKTIITVDDILDDNNQGVETVRESMAKRYDEDDANLILTYKYPPRKIFNYLIYNWRCKSHIRKKQFWKAIDLCPCLYYSDMK